MILEWGIQTTSDCAFGHEAEVTLMPDEESADFAAGPTDNVMFRYVGEWTKA